MSTIIRSQPPIVHRNPTPVLPGAVGSLALKKPTAVGAPNNKLPMPRLAFNIDSDENNGGRLARLNANWDIIDLQIPARLTGNLAGIAPTSYLGRMAIKTPMHDLFTRSGAPSWLPVSPRVMVWKPTNTSIGSGATLIWSWANTAENQGLEGDWFTGTKPQISPTYPGGTGSWILTAAVASDIGTALGLNLAILIRVNTVNTLAYYSDTSAVGHTKYLQVSGVVELEAGDDLDVVMVNTTAVAWDFELSLSVPQLTAVRIT